MKQGVLRKLHSGKWDCWIKGQHTVSVLQRNTTTCAQAGVGKSMFTVLHEKDMQAMMIIIALPTQRNVTIAQGHLGRIS